MGTTDLPCQKCFKVKTVSLFGGAGDVHSGRGKRVMAVKSYGAITQYGRSQRGGGQPAHSPLLFLSLSLSSFSHEGEGAMTGVLSMY